VTSDDHDPPIPDPPFPPLSPFSTIGTGQMPVTPGGLGRHVFRVGLAGRYANRRGFGTGRGNG
jgi:hypothetical protein